MHPNACKRFGAGTAENALLAAFVGSFFPTSLFLPLRQVSLGPVWAGSGSGLGGSAQALPSSLILLDLLADLGAVRQGGMARGTWCVELLDFAKRSVPAALELCAVFDQPGGQCGLVGRVCLTFEPPEEAEPGTTAAYLGQCAEVAGRLRGGGDDGLELTLAVDDWAAEADGAGELAGCSVRCWALVPFT
jgi:hypothetical protein